MQTSMPTSFAERQAALKKKQMLAEALMAQGMQQPNGQMVGDHFVAPTAVAHLAPLIQAFMGNRMQGKVEEGQAALKNDYQKALADQLTAYKTAAAENPEAARDYMTSEFDPVKQMATADYERLQKAMTPRVVGGELVAQDPQGNVKSLYNTNPQYTPVQDIMTTEDGRTLKGVYNTKTNEPKVLPGQSKGIQINTGDSAWDKKFVEVATKRLDESYESTASKVNAVRSLDAAAEDLERGIRSGMAADVQLGLAKAYSLFSGQPLDEIDINTETFNNNMKRQVAAIAKSIFTGVMTDTDRKFLEDMSGANPSLDAASISRLLKYTKADAYNNLLEHKKLLDKTKNNPKLGAELDADFWSLELPPITETPDKDGIYFDKKLGRYRVQPPEVKKEAPQADGTVDQYQGVKPVGINAQGMPQYRLEDLRK